MSDPFYIPDPGPPDGSDPYSISVPGVGGQPPTMLRQAGSGLLTGALEIPLAGWMFSKALTGSGMVSQDQLNGMAAAAQAGPVGRTAQLVGEFAPQLLLGPPIWGVGKKLALAAVAKVGSEVVGGQAGALAVREAALAGADTVAPLLQRAMGGPLRKQLADTVLLAGGDMGALTGSPAILRTAEVLAGNSLYGAITTADALLEGKPLLESAQQGATATLLGVGLEGAGTMAFKAAFPAARATDKALQVARAAKVPELQNFLGQTKVELGEAVTAAQEKVHRAGLAEQSALAKFADSLGGTEVAAQLEQELVAAKALRRAGIMEGRAARTVKAGFETGQATEATGLDLVTGTVRGHAPIGSGALGEAEALVQRGLLTVATTPADVGRKLGVQAARLLKLGRDAEALTGAEQGIVARDVLDIAAAMHRIVGVKANRVLPGEGGKFLLDYLHALQKGGRRGLQAFAASEGLGPQQIDELVKWWGIGEDNLSSGIVQMVRQKVGELVKVGVDAKVPKGGIAMVLRDDLDTSVLKTKLRDAFVKLGQGYESADTTAQRLINLRTSKNGMFTGQDEINDALGGLTMKEAIEAGFPIIEDPLVAFQVYMGGLNKRVNYAKVFGPKNEVANIMVKAAQREGASEPLVQAMLDGMMLKSYGDQGARRVAAAIGNAQAAARMTFSVIPNASQSVLTAVQHGSLNTLRMLMPGGKARALLPTGRSYEAEIIGTGIGNSINSAYRETYLDANFRTPLGWLADLQFTATGFNRMEAFNRSTAAGVAIYDTVRTLTMLAEGRLRGQSLTTAARKLQSLGLDATKLSTQVRQHIALARGDVDQGLANFLNAQGGDFMKRLAWRGAQHTQFLPTPSTKPTFWNSPEGRVMFQFKTFALGQARLMRDSVLAEAAQGNHEPLARMLLLAPPAGEAVRYLQSQFKTREANNRQRPDNDIERLLADVGALGGFGIVSDTVMAARNSRLLGFAVGPTASDVTRIFEAISRGDSNRIAKQVAQTPAARAVNFLYQPLSKVTAKAMGELREHSTTNAGDYDIEQPAPSLADYGRTQ